VHITKHWLPLEVGPDNLFGEMVMRQIRARRTPRAAFTPGGQLHEHLALERHPDPDRVPEAPQPPCHRDNLVAEDLGTLGKLWLHSAAIVQWLP